MAGSFNSGCLHAGECENWECKAGARGPSLILTAWNTPAESRLFSPCWETDKSGVWCCCCWRQWWQQQPCSNGTDSGTSMNWRQPGFPSDLCISASEDAAQSVEGLLPQFTPPWDVPAVKPWDAHWDKHSAGWQSTVRRNNEDIYEERRQSSQAKAQVFTLSRSLLTVVPLKPQIISTQYK